MANPSRYDSWLDSDSVAALVIREHLVPIEGPDGVLFPATYAGKDGAPGGYNIDPPQGEKNVCQIDSVGSQANRIEPMFAKEDYLSLVPQITIKAGEKSINLLEAGHRAGDAVVRCTALQATLQEAFKAVRSGDSWPMAKIAPTSIVFGVWDSRDTHAKLPRLIASTIRAFDVRQLRRSAQFNPATQYLNDGLVPEPGDKAAKEELAKRGFTHVPSSATPGGVIATGGVRRDATLSLAALRLLSTGAPKKTLLLRRYILGLSLVALTASAATYLRQGCNLVLDLEKGREFTLVYSGGKREILKLSHADALAFARSAAAAFGVGESCDVIFDKELATKDIAGEAGTPAAVRKSAKQESGRARRVA